MTSNVAVLKTAKTKQTRTTLNKVNSSKLGDYMKNNLPAFGSMTHAAFAEHASKALGFAITVNNVKSWASSLGLKRGPGGSTAKPKVQKKSAALSPAALTMNALILRKAIELVIDELEPVFDVAGADFSKLQKFRDTILTTRGKVKH